MGPLIESRCGRFGIIAPVNRSTQPPAATQQSSVAPVILSLSVCAFASAASMRLCDPMLPALMVEFNAELTAVAVTVTAFAFAYGGAQLLFGPLGERYGKLRVIAGAIVAAAIGSLLCMLAPSLPALIAARALTGAACSAIVPLSMAWIGDEVPYAIRQTTLARYLLGQMLGLSGGQLIGGALTDWIHWRSCFVVLIVIYLIALARLATSLRARGVRAPAPDPQRSFWSATRRVARSARARRLLLTVGLEGMLVFGAQAFVASYLHLRFGQTVAAAGLFAALFGVGGLLYGLNTSRLLGRLGERGLAIGGGLILAAALATLAASSVSAIAVSMSLFIGLGYYMLHNTLQTHATQMDPLARGVALAWFATALWLGQAIGVAGSAQLIARFDYAPVFMSCALALLLLALWFSRDARAAD